MGKCIPLAERFWAKVARDETAGGCWEWQHFIAPSGYGQFWLAGRNTGAHRVAYALGNGEFDQVLFVLHRCDNRICCRPSHLFLGTQADNIADMIRKGRCNHGDKHPLRKNPSLACRGDNHPMRKHPELCVRGERQGSAKLTEQSVRFIQHQIAVVGRTGKSVGTEMGIHESTALRIGKKKVWKHLWV